MVTNGNNIPRPAAAVRPAPAAAGAMALTPKEVFGILRRHIFLIVSMTVLGILVGGVAWYLLKEYSPKYTAQTFLRVLSPVIRDPMTIGGGPAAKDIQYGYRLSLANLITRQSNLEEILTKDKIKGTEWFGQFGSQRAVAIRKAVKDLQQNFGANALRDAEFIALSMTCGSAEESALIVNEMLNLFLASQGASSRGDIATKLARLEDQRVRVQRDLDVANRSLDEVRNRWGIMGLEVRGSIEHTITKTLNDLALQQNDLLLQVRQTEAAIQTLQKHAESPINEQIENQIETDPIMVMLAQQRANLETTLGGAMTRFGENHRLVRELRERIDSVIDKRQIRKAEISEQVRRANLQDAQDTMVLLLSRREELTRLHEEAAAKQRDLDLARVQYEQRVAIRDERKQMLDAVMEQIDKLRIMHDDPETPKIEFVGYAPVPLEVSSPKLMIYMPGGTMLGMMLGVGLAFLIELLNDLVRTPSDVAKHLRVRLLGVVPHVDEDRQVAGVDLAHVVRDAPFSMISESYRTFRTNLKLAGSDRKAKVILVTSGLSGAGTSCVAVNLATSLVAEDSRVLLVDGNFRRPGLDRMLSAPSSSGSAAESAPGLSNILADGGDAGRAIRPSGMEGCDVVVSGPMPPNPSEALSSRTMADFIAAQREVYDYVIIDGPPTLLVSDARTLAGLADTTVLVFNAATTRRGTAVRTIRELAQAGADIAGCVLLGVRSLKGGYFQEQFRLYQQYLEPQRA